MLAVITFTLLLSQPAPALGQPAPAPNAGSTATSNSGNAVSAPNNPGFFGSMGLEIIGSALWILRSALAFILSLVSPLLDDMLKINVELNPALMPAVQEGWRILRDFVNVFFILVMIWIALTIIFNFEEWGGKALLIRVVVVALLINFSLVFVTMIFGFTNILAGVFSDNLPRDPTHNNDLVVSAFIVDRLKVQTLLQQPNPAQVKETAKETRNPFPETKEGQNFKAKHSAGDTLVAALGIRQAKADVSTTIGFAGAGCAIALWAGPIGCGGGALIGALTGALFQWGRGTIGNTYQLAMQEAAMSLFLIITIATFLVAGLFLLIRIIAMTILSILAPVAFVAYVVPGRTGKQYFDKWLNAVVRWAFFAPLFYLLMYISLYMLQQFKQSGGAFWSINVLGNPNYFIAALSSLAFMIAAVYITRRTGGAIAETAIGLGKTGAGFLVGGAAGLAVGGAARAFAPLAERTSQAVDRSAVLKRIPGLQRGLMRVSREKRSSIEEDTAKYKNFSVNELKRMLPSEFRTRERVAIAKAIADQGEIGELDDATATKTLTELKKIGVNIKPYLRQKPLLATPELWGEVKPEELRDTRIKDPKTGAIITQKETQEEAILRITIESTKPKDIEKLQDNDFKYNSTQKGTEFTNRKFLESMLLHASTQNMSQTLRHNPQNMTNLMDFFKDHQEVYERMTDDRRRVMQKFIHSPLMQAYGHQFSNIPYPHDQRNIDAEIRRLREADIAAGQPLKPLAEYETEARRQRQEREQTEEET